ncbi:MAG: molybdate ABC transporter substrate-binding protein [Actinobacteria bacterium]|nr:molybdate ABC transporter substrate-binding protein [Actinomycetota bacterium]
MTAFKRLATLVTLLVITSALTAPTSHALSGKCTSGAAIVEGVRYTCVAKKWQVVTLRGTLVVLAASSLTEVALDLERAFKRIYPQADLIFSFGGSGTLAQQAINGVPADLFLSAGPAPMKLVAEKNALAGFARDFATNSLVIAVPKENPLKISSLSDFSRSKIAICAPEVPCGVLAQNVARAAKITLKPVTLELNVKSVEAKILLGEVDAGLIYRTDVISSSKLLAIEIPEAMNLKTTYSIAPLPSKKSNVNTRDAFIYFLLSSKGKSLLSKAGFAQP